MFHRKVEVKPNCFRVKFISCLLGPKVTVDPEFSVLDINIQGDYCDLILESWLGDHYMISSSTETI